MKHRVGFNRLGKKPSHRNSMINSMVTSLFKYERITTTSAKAKEARRAAEKMVTRAKIDSVHNRRQIARRIRDKGILDKLFTDISPRFIEKPGGYTRILKMGYRNNDAAQMVLLELVERSVVEKTKKRSKTIAEPETQEPAAEHSEGTVEAEETSVEEPVAEKEEGKKQEQEEVVREETSQEKIDEEKISKPEAEG